MNTESDFDFLSRCMDHGPHLFTRLPFAELQRLAKLAGADAPLNKINEKEVRRWLTLAIDRHSQPKFVTVEMPCISMKHLSSDTYGELIDQIASSENGPTFRVAFSEGTCFMVAPAQEEYGNFPLDLRDLFAWANQYASFGWIMLDVDGDVQSNLATYEE